MGIVSSIFIHVVINVCWQCRLYMEGDPRSHPPVSSPESGFLSTPDATSTPQSPLLVKDANQVTNFEVNAKRTVKDKRYRNKPRSHRLSEILSPAEEEMIRITMARGYVTPASVRSKSSLRNVNRAPFRGSVPNVVQRFPDHLQQYLSPAPINYRTRGMRI